MQTKTIQELNEIYELDLDNVISNIKKNKASKVLLQFPEGLKPYSLVINEYLEEKCNDVKFIIWLGTCFGACDIPLDVERLGVDMIVQFGHTAWSYKDKDIKVLD